MAIDDRQGVDKMDRDSMERLVWRVLGLCLAIVFLVEDVPGVPL